MNFSVILRLHIRALKSHCGSRTSHNRGKWFHFLLSLMFASWCFYKLLEGLQLEPAVMVQAKLFHLFEEFCRPCIDVLVMLFEVFDLHLDQDEVFLFLKLTHHAFVQRRLGVL